LRNTYGDTEERILPVGTTEESAKEAARKLDNYLTYTDRKDGRYIELALFEVVENEIANEGEYSWSRYTPIAF